MNATTSWSDTTRLRFMRIYVRLDQHREELEAIVFNGALLRVQVEQAIDFLDGRFVLLYGAEHVRNREVEQVLASYEPCAGAGGGHRSVSVGVWRLVSGRR